MKNLSILAFVVAALPLSALAGCPDLSGSFKVTKASEDAGDNAQVGQILTIAQTACAEVDVTQASDGSPATTEKYITDGQPHDFGGIPDVGVSFTMTSSFDGNSMVAKLGMPGLPAGTSAGTFTYTIDSTGKILTVSMDNQDETYSFTAEKQ